MDDGSRLIFMSFFALLGFIILPGIINQIAQEDAWRDQKYAEEQIIEEKRKKILPLKHTVLSNPKGIRDFIDPHQSLTGLREQCSMEYATRVDYRWSPHENDTLLVTYTIQENRGPLYGNDCPASGVFIAYKKNFLKKIVVGLEEEEKRLALLQKALKNTPQH